MKLPGTLVTKKTKTAQAETPAPAPEQTQEQTTPAPAPELSPPSAGGGSPQGRTNSGERVHQEREKARKITAGKPPVKDEGSDKKDVEAAQGRRYADLEQPRLHRRPPRPLDRARRPQLHHPQVPRSALPPSDLPGCRDRVRHPLGGPGGDQRDRDGLRPQPQRVLRGRAGLDAVHAVHLEDVRHRRQQGQAQGSVQPGRRDLRGRPLPQGRRLPGRRAPRDLRLQPRRLVRRLGAPARAADRRRAGRPDRLAHRPDRGPLPRLRARALRGRPGRGRAAQARQAGRERRQRDRVRGRPPLDRHLRAQRLAGRRRQRRRDQEDRRERAARAAT